MNEIKILGQIYRISEVECVSKEDPEKGSIDFLTHEIRIDKSMPDDLKKQTMLHEVIHAICDALGMYELGGDEQAVQSLATALYSVFGDQITFSS
ncbi:MAG: hypothetical protein SPL54_08605 [Lachnospiraceae bacterium]|nr:hypothetical protein [Lachnospiraceae bacterium]